MEKVILDTNILLNKPELIHKYDKVVLPLIVCEELDNLKHNGNDNQKFKSRQAHRELEKATNIEYRVESSFALHFKLDINKPDNQILSYAKDTGAKLITLDKNMVLKARALDIECEQVIDDSMDYKGWKIVEMSEEELANWYESQNKKNDFNLLINEYLLIKSDGKIVDIWKYTKNGFKQPNRKEFKSKLFGRIQSKDIYQALAMDSLLNDKFTILTGVAGTAKTLLSLSYLLWGLEYGKIGKVYIVHNPCPLKGSTYQGYYSGDRTDKLLQTSIGGILTTKFGDSQIIDSMINNNQLELIPASDIRGIEIPDDCALYATEAQNSSSYLMKTIIQRCSENSKIILEGDTRSQVDKSVFNSDNGLRRAIEIFKGDEDFSCVNLIGIYRNRLAEIAEKM